MRPALAWLLLSLAGCEGQGVAEPAPADPERAAIELLRGHVFDPVEQLRPRFGDGVDPADFPLRLMLDGPEQYRYRDIWRLRTIDGRLVVWALVDLDGAPHVFEMWLERQRGAWRVAGWSQVPEQVEPDQPAQPAPTRVPTPFAAATFRGAPPAATVPVELSAAPSEPAPASRVDVTLKRPTFDGDCPKATLIRKLRDLRPEVARCYAAGAALEAGRMGRVTLTLLLDGRAAATDARVTETTLVDDALGRCLERTLGSLPVTVGRTEVCTVRAAYTFRPAARR